MRAHGDSYRKISIDIYIIHGDSVEFNNAETPKASCTSTKAKNHRMIITEFIIKKKMKIEFYL